MATSLSLENDSSLAQGYLKVNGSTAATLTTSGITGNLTGNVTGNLTGSLTQGGSLTFATAQTASGTSVDFTGIPSWAKRITVMLNQVSFSGTSAPLIRLGTSSGIVSTGYNSDSSGSTATGNTLFSSTVGHVLLSPSNGGFTYIGSIVFNNVSSNIWIGNGMTYYGAAGGTISVHTSVVNIGSTLDRLRITTTNGTDTFDAGTINISYEG
jgi:hypothetical protein